MTVMEIVVATPTIAGEISPKMVSRFLYQSNPTTFVGTLVAESEDAVLLALGVSNVGLDSVVRIPQKIIISAEVIDGDS